MYKEITNVNTTALLRGNAKTSLNSNPIKSAVDPGSGIDWSKYFSQGPEGLNLTSQGLGGIGGGLGALLGGSLPKDASIWKRLLYGLGGGLLGAGLGYAGGELFGKGKGLTMPWFKTDPAPEGAPAAPAAPVAPNEAPSITPDDTDIGG